MNLDDMVLGGAFEIYKGTQRFSGEYTPKFGNARVIYVDPVNGADTRSGRTATLAVKTLAAGEDKLRSGYHDTLCYISGTSSLSLTEELVWDKSYAHFVGLCAPTGVGQRARIFNTAGAAYDTAFASKALLKVTGSGCFFKDLYFFQGADKVSQYYGSGYVSGSRNVFKNVHFAGMGATASGSNAAAAGSYSLEIAAGSENLFDDCTIGVDTITRTADNAPLYLTGDHRRNHFRKCRILSAAETAGYIAVRNDGGGSFTYFEDCLFYNFWTNHANKCTDVFEDTNGATHDLILNPGCMMVGYTGWGDGVTQLWVMQGFAAATTGIAINPAA